MSRPNIADRHADAQLAPLRLGAGGVEHAGAQHPELELADAPLHPEQPVVRPAGVVDAIEIDHPRLDQATAFEQVVPVAAVAREPGGVEAEHRADFAGAATPPGRPSPAAPPCRWRSGRDRRQSPRRCESPGVGPRRRARTAPLALEVGLDLRLRRLPNVDHVASCRIAAGSSAPVIAALPGHDPRCLHQQAGETRDDGGALTRVHPAKLHRIQRHAQLARRPGGRRHDRGVVMMLLPDDG